VAVRPPSLRAIAAFEAAARHESFTKAADELNLTQSAISHAVRSLETRLGVDLFERYGRTVALTEAGRAFVSRLRLSLNLISEAFEAPARPGRARLVVAATAGIAERILAIRLPAFLARTPDREIELRTVTGAAEVTAGEVDVALLYGAGSCAGLTQRRLAGEALFPVAAPTLEEQWANLFPAMAIIMQEVVGVMAWEQDYLDAARTSVQGVSYNEVGFPYFYGAWLAE